MLAMGQIHTILLVECQTYIKGAKSNLGGFWCLGFYSYGRLPMLYYSLKHVESPLCVSSAQKPLFHKLKCERNWKSNLLYV